MIQIDRCNAPPVLKGSPQAGTHYNKPSVVKALWGMQNGKCCYCEQRIPEEGHMKWVEHFHPQSASESERNHWPNLLLACAQCNGKKSDKFPVELTEDSGQSKVLYQKRNLRGKPLIIDPSDPDTDPEAHIDFVVHDGEVEFGMARAKEGSRAGLTTITVVGLTDPYYVRKRKTFYRRELNRRYMELLEAEDQQEFVEEAKRSFARLLSAKGEFAGFARAYAKAKRSKLEALGLRIPKGAEEADAVLQEPTPAQIRSRGTT